MRKKDGTMTTIATVNSVAQKEAETGIDQTQPLNLEAVKDQIAEIVPREEITKTRNQGHLGNLLNCQLDHLLLLT
jgi:hypothetical protein